MNAERLKQSVGKKTFEKGMDLFQFGIITDIKKSFNLPDSTLEITGKVLETAQKSYQTEIDYSITLRAYINPRCSCGSFGICSHIVALLLKLDSMGDTESKYIQDFSEMYDAIDTWSDEDIIRELDRNYKKSKSRTTSKKKREFVTSSSLAELLKKKTMAQLPMKNQEYYGELKFEIFYSDKYYRDCASVSFKVGVGKMYVIKNVISFGLALQKREKVRYGKYLEFYHAVEMFQEEYQPVARFIIDWVEKHKEEYAWYDYYTDTDTYRAERYIPLNDKTEMDLFFDAVSQCGFTHDTLHRKYQVVTEPFKIGMKFQSSEEGLQISFAQNIRGITTEKYLNMWEKEKLVRIPWDLFQEDDRAFFDCMLQADRDYLSINPKDLPSFCANLLPALKNSEVLTCDLNGFDAEGYLPMEALFEFYLDMPQEDMVTCDIRAVYGAKSFSVFQTEEQFNRRDVVKELQVRQMADTYFNAYDPNDRCLILSEDEELLYRLLSEGIAWMHSVGEVFISGELNKLRVEPTPHVQIGVSVGEVGVNLQMISEDLAMEELVEILSKYTPQKKYHRLKNGNFISTQDDSIAKLVQLKDSMNLTTAQMKKGNVVLPKYRALYMDVLLQEVRGIRYSREKEFKRLVRDMKTVEEMECDIPEEIDSVLREYQRTGVAWLNTLYHNGFSGILADDMGLGKTLQTIAFLAMLWRDQQEKESKVDALALVVTPASLVYNWENELQKFAPHLPVRLMIGKQDVRLQLLQEIQKDEIVITSYDLLKRDIDSYQNLTFACQVIDEAQNIKNHTTQAAKAVKVVQAGFHIALTGTPIENRLSELWSIFDFLMPGFLYSYKKFREKWEIPVVQNQEKEVAERLQKMISPFLLRRLKKDVLQDLPDKLEEDYYAQLEGEQQKLYDAHVKRIQLVLQTSSDQEFKKSKLQILSELTKLRQICCDPALLYSDYRQGSAKLEMCMELLRNAVNGGHKILLFSQFTTMLDRIAERLKEEKISFFMLTGATDKRKRKEMVESFNKDATSVFCISLKAGGTGLNLAAADIVIHYDPWWNEAVQNQATDRAHRIGQQNVVNVYRLISKGTIEEKIVKLQEQKKALADQILSGDGFSQSNFSKEELLELLGGEE